MQKYNLLKRADAYVQQIAQQYMPRAAFAFEQTLSDAVKLKHLYSDDVDVCFVFSVKGVTVDVYCNYNSNNVTGYVYVQDAVQADAILREHFALAVADSVASADSVYYSAVAA